MRGQAPSGPTKRWGQLLYGAEAAIGGAWMLGELAVAATRPRDFLSDPHWHDVVLDIERRGFYQDLEPVTLVEKKGWLRGENPYRRIIRGARRAPPDRLVARVVRGRGREEDRRLLVVHHCYGVPSPGMMESLFGLDALDDVDVVYPIMNHHALGSFRAWPGTGFVRARASHMLENVRAAVSGARAVVEALVRQRKYAKVTALGYSIGGQLVLHLANSAPLDQAILYCPVVNVRVTARELGFGLLGRPLEALSKHVHGLGDLASSTHADPLSHTMRIPESSLHVLAQAHDAMTPLHHLELIRARYPGVSFQTYAGTHLYPAGRSAFQRFIRARV